MPVHIVQIVESLIENLSLDFNRRIVSSSLGQATYFHRDYSHPTADASRALVTGHLLLKVCMH